MRGSVQRAIGGYDPALPHSGDLEMWLRAAAVADIGRVNGANQAYYRVHPTSMQRTVHAGYLTDLEGRRDAFESVLLGPEPVSRPTRPSGSTRWPAGPWPPTPSTGRVAGLRRRASTDEEPIDDSWRSPRGVYPEARDLREPGGRCTAAGPPGPSGATGACRAPAAGSSATSRAASAGAAGAGAACDRLGTAEPDGPSGEHPRPQGPARRGVEHARGGRRPARPVRPGRGRRPAAGPERLRRVRGGARRAHHRHQRQRARRQRRADPRRRRRGRPGRPDGRRPSPSSASLVLGVLMAISAPLAGPAPRLTSGAGAIAVMALTLPLAGISAVPVRVPAPPLPDGSASSWPTRPTWSPPPSWSSRWPLAGWGPMALAWSWVAGPAADHRDPADLQARALLAGLGPRSRPGGSLRFGLPLAGANILAFSVLNVDYIVVGRVLGATALGLYVLAFNISGWPMNVFGAVVRSVSLPGFAHLQRDGDAMPDALHPALGAGGHHHPADLRHPRRAGRPRGHGRLRRRVGGRRVALVGLCVLGARPHPASS